MASYAKAGIEALHDAYDLLDGKRRQKFRQYMVDTDGVTLFFYDGFLILREWEPIYEAFFAFMEEYCNLYRRWTEFMACHSCHHPVRTPENLFDEIVRKPLRFTMMGGNAKLVGIANKLLEYSKNKPTLHIDKLLFALYVEQFVETAPTAEPQTKQKAVDYRFKFGPREVRAREGVRVPGSDALVAPKASRWPSWSQLVLQWSLNSKLEKVKSYASKFLWHFQQVVNNWRKYDILDRKSEFRPWTDGDGELDTVMRRLSESKSCDFLSFSSLTVFL